MIWGKDLYTPIPSEEGRTDLGPNDEKEINSGNISVSASDMRA
jgi:hypothetical protein